LESLALVSPNTMRLMLMTGVAAAMFLDPRASHAHEGPWCALTNIGGGTMYENCSMRTLHQRRWEDAPDERRRSLRSLRLHGRRLALAT
jgi:hypothetical protein